MDYHPYCDIWPLMEGLDFDKLKADIAAYGLRMNLITYRGKLLDGRNRERACEAAGIVPRYADANVKTDEEALELVVSLNEHRRHMSMEQRSFAAARLANFKPGRPSELTLAPARVSSIKSTGGSFAVRDAAARLNVSPGSTARARAIIQHGTKADEEDVLKGRVSLTARAEQLTKRNKPAPNRLPRQEPRKISLPQGNSLISLTPQQVDPEFIGTPMDFTKKYGHVQIMTAEQYATDRFGDWVSLARTFVRAGREHPEIREVDHNWLRNPSARDIAKLTEALEYLRPKVAELEALLAIAVKSLQAKQV